MFYFFKKNFLKKVLPFLVMPIIANAQTLVWDEQKIFSPSSVWGDQLFRQGQSYGQAVVNDDPSGNLDFSTNYYDLANSLFSTISFCDAYKEKFFISCDVLSGGIYSSSDWRQYAINSLRHYIEFVATRARSDGDYGVPAYHRFTDGLRLAINEGISYSEATQGITSSGLPASWNELMIVMRDLTDYSKLGVYPYAPNPPFTVQNGEFERGYGINQYRFNLNGFIPCANSDPELCDTFTLNDWIPLQEGGFVLPDDLTQDELEKEYIYRDEAIFIYAYREDLSGVFDPENHRNTAYAFEAHINAEKSGLPRDDVRVDLLLNALLHYFKQWRTMDTPVPVEYTTIDANPDARKRFTLFDSAQQKNTMTIKPFMLGLASRALMKFYDWERENGRLDTHSKTRDIPQIVSNTLLFLYKDATVQEGTFAGDPLWYADGNSATHDGFFYVDRFGNLANGDCPEKPIPGDCTSSGTIQRYITPGLNLMIAPAYAWLARYYHLEHLKDSAQGYDQLSADLLSIGDNIFMHGTNYYDNQNFFNGKLYNQFFRWGFDYFEYRSLAYPGKKPTWAWFPEFIVDN